MSPVRVKPCDEVIFQPLQDEIVLLNMKDQRYFGLDDVGSAMWKLLVEVGDLETVADRICVEYDVDRATVRSDLNSLVADLIAAGLITTAGSDTRNGALADT